MKVQAHLLEDSLSSFTSFEYKDHQSYAILKRFTRRLYEVRELDLQDYDSQKSLMNFFAQVFQGYDWHKGCRNFDIIERAIRKL